MRSEEATSLETPFAKEKVWSILSSLCGNKASRLDGFTMAYWWLCKDFVKQEVMVFQAVFNNSSFKRSLNVTFLVLI